MARPRGTDSARVIPVIETQALRGNGTDEDKCYPIWALLIVLLYSVVIITH